MTVHQTTSDLPATDPYPRAAARTRNFTLGIPRAITVAPDGSRIAFLRAASGSNPTGELWVYDVPLRQERRIVDPAGLLDARGEALSAQERARRERARESGAGVVGYATDEPVRRAVFALSSRLWLVDLVTGTVTELPAAGDVVDPRLSPDGTRIAYVADRALHVIGADGSGARAVAVPESPTVAYGLAEFAAAEEMDRSRGFWWSPDSASLLVERYDEAAVPVWHISDPATPAAPATAVHYPAAGTTNATVTLSIRHLDGAECAAAAESCGATGTAVAAGAAANAGSSGAAADGGVGRAPDELPVRWDPAYEYLGRVSWPDAAGPLLQVLARDQRRAQVLAVNPITGATAVVATQADPDWVDLVDGLPARLPDGRVVTAVDDPDARRLAVGAVPLSPPGLDIRAVCWVDAGGLLVTASRTADLGEIHVLRIATDGTATRLSRVPGVHTGAAGGDVVVLTSTTLDSALTRTTVLAGGEGVGTIASRQETAPVAPYVWLRRYGADALPSAVLLPAGHEPGAARLPVLLDPYGGPHGQRVLAARRGYNASQWWADQGYAVLVADGRGMPGRGPAWERRVRGDFIGTLDDQVAALEALCSDRPEDVDPGRVAIRGWSYGGYLAALAVLRRPDVIHAAVAGAPPTDWRLYDTCYTERYLGHPDTDPETYDRNGLLRYAADLRRPLLLIHGLADDNVVAAHTLRLSAALLAAGRPHRVLPLSGITHMASQADVAEGMLRLEADFLAESLRSPGA